VAAVLSLALFSPILWMIRISLSTRQNLFTMPPQLFLDEINLNGYVSMLSRLNFLRFYLNSVIVAFGTVAISLICGTLAAYSFSRFKYRGRRTLMLITLSSQMFPWALLSISLYMLYIRTSLLDTYLGLMLAHSTFALPLTIWIIKGYFDTLPRELEESAYIDGSSRLNTMLRIALPLTAPGLTAAGIYIFLFSWNDFLFGLTLTTNESRRILAPGIVMEFIGEFELLWIDMMAASVVIAIPVVALFLSLQSYFVKGLTAGAVKG